MNGLRKAQNLYDRRLPGDFSARCEREFQHPEFAPADAHVIRSAKFIDLKPTAETPANGEQKTSG